MDGRSNRRASTWIDLVRLFVVAWISFLIYTSAVAADIIGEEDTSIPFWIYFTDKGYTDKGDIDKALSEAEINLSERAWKRRAKLDRKNLVDLLDLPVNSLYINELTKLIGNAPRSVSRWLNAVSFNLKPTQVNQVKGLSFVSRIERVHSFIRHRPSQVPVPDDPNLPIPHRDDHRFEYGTSYTQNAFLNIPELHDENYLGQGVLIGITDTGFDNLDHNCFETLDIVAAWDFLNDDGDVADGDDLGEGNHGTKTLSILAGFDPGTFLGAAPRASYVLAKTECSEWEREVEEDYWVEAIEWMDALGVEVVSVSLSYTDWYDYEDMDGETGVTTIAAAHATEVGMVIVVSMGNNGQNNYPREKMGAPADGVDVYAVGATSRDSLHAAFSAHGPTFDGRIKPDFTTFGSSVRFASSSHDDRYGAGAGTSFTVPAISGLCALLIQVNPVLTPNSLRELLREVSHNNEEPDTLLGWGIPDGEAALDIILPQYARMTIPLRIGWNLVSKNLSSPGILQIEDVFDRLVERGSLSLVRDGAGNFYSPAFNFNCIPCWNLYEGYHIRMRDLDTLIFEGIPVDFTQPVHLEEGWQIISYLPSFPLSVEVALSSLIQESSLIIAKNEDGDFFLPENGFNNMPDLVTGKGYQIALSEASDLVYPRRRAANNVRHLQAEPIVFPCPPPQINGMSVLIYGSSDIHDGDEIGFFNKTDQLVGSGVFSDGKCGVALWSDEKCPFPDVRIYQHSLNRIIEPDIEWIKGCYDYEPNGIAIIRILAVDAAAKTKLRKPRIVPNPFNHRLVVQYPAVLQNVVEISVFDLQGRRLERLLQKSSMIENGMVIFNTIDWAGGSYIIQVKSGNEITRMVARHVK